MNVMKTVFSKKKRCNEQSLLLRISTLIKDNISLINTNNIFLSPSMCIRMHCCCC